MRPIMEEHTDIPVSLNLAFDLAPLRARLQIAVDVWWQANSARIVSQITKDAEREFKESGRAMARELVQKLAHNAAHDAVDRQLIAQAAKSAINSALRDAAKKAVELG